MTKLQQLLLKLAELRKLQKEAFGKYADLAQMPAAEVEAAKARNTEIETLAAEAKGLEELEVMKRGADTDFKHQADEDTKDQRDDQGNKMPSRDRELTRVKTLPRYGKVKNFKGDDATLKAYQFGMWFAGTVLHEKYPSAFTQKARQYCADWGLTVKAQSEGVNTAGGYLVPHEFSNDIIDLREEFGVFRRNTKVVPMLRETKSVPRRVSGLTVYYPGEGVAITESQKTWDMVSLTARKYAALALYSSELFEDAIISIGDDLSEEIAYAFAVAEDQNGFNGDGTSGFAGTTGVRQRLLDVYTVSGGVGLKVGAGNNWADLLLTDFEAVLGALPIYARRRAKWFCSSTFFHTVMHKLQLAAGGVTSMEIAGGGQFRFLGLPVEESQVFPMTEANSHIPVVLGDLMMASKLGDRRELTIAFSDQYKFAEDQLAIRGTQRIDINVHDVGDATNAGPVVGLITAAS